MELRQLRYLLAIAEEKNFTRAAGKIFITQSALSQQIQTLEQDLGTILLDRSKREVRLTAAGEIVCHHARRALDELEQAKIAVEELEGLQRGMLTVGVVQTANDYFMPGIVAQFMAHYPDVKLSIEELSMDEIETRLEQGRLQVGMGFIPPTRLSIEYESLFEEVLTLVVREDHPFAGYDAISVRELDRLPMITLAKTFCTRRLWEEQALLAGAQPRVVLEMNTINSILSAVVKTGLATVLPRMILMEAHIDRLVSIPIHSPTLRRQVGLLWHRDHYLCSASRAFIEMAKGIAMLFVGQAVTLTPVEQPVS